MIDPSMFAIGQIGRFDGADVVMCLMVRFVLCASCSVFCLEIFCW